MKPLALTIAFTLLSAGCLSTFIPDPKPASGAADMGSATGTGGNGNGTGTGEGTGDPMGSGDGGSSAAVSTDMAGATPGTAAFGASCTVNEDCQSLLCEPFVMGTVHRCTKTCTVATQATDCPAPSDGTCTNNGYCKFSQ